ncbi:MAG: CPBP family intramembrane glutamic endopeptidase [bacterium]
MPVLADFLFVFVLVVAASVAEHYWFWPSFRSEVAAGEPDARVRGYRRGIVAQWSFVIAASTIWTSHGRSLVELRLVAPDRWKLAVGGALVIAMLVLVWVQHRSITRLTEERRVAVGLKFGAVAFLLPHTLREHRWFLGLSITAGICEELLYRGYLTWFLSPWLGTAGAYLAVIALFGIGHAYQGRKGATRATLAGAVMAAIVLATGWLVPAMIIHALIDMSSGTAGFMLLRESRPENSLLRGAHGVEPLTG